MNIGGPLSLVRSDGWTDVVVDQMKARASAIADEGRECIEKGGQVAWWMRDKITAFRAATAVGNARVQAAELLCTAMWIDHHFKAWEKERAAAVKEADALFGGDFKKRVKVVWWTQEPKPRSSKKRVKALPSKRKGKTKR